MTENKVIDLYAMDEYTIERIIQQEIQKDRELQKRKEKRKRQEERSATEFMCCMIIICVVFFLKWLLFGY